MKKFVIDYLFFDGVKLNDKVAKDFVGLLNDFWETSEEKALLKPKEKMYLEYSGFSPEKKGISRVHITVKSNLTKDHVRSTIAAAAYYDHFKDEVNLMFGKKTEIEADTKIKKGDQVGQKGGVGCPQCGTAIVSF